MCGINGYVGNKGKKAVEYLTYGLGLLKYRGYDSGGIVTIGKSVSGMHMIAMLKTTETDILKDLYTVECFENAYNAHIGIGHTRWATHGARNVENAHPHMDCKKEIAVVHNGIIDNYLELFDKYPDHTRRSETDSEIIAHLIEEYKKGGLSFEEAFKRTVEKLDGTYAIAAIDNGDPDNIMVACKDSPLIIGTGYDENYISSDIISLMEYTDRFIRLEDFDVAKITKDRIEIYNNGEKVERKDIKIGEINEWSSHSVKDICYDKESCLWGPYITKNEIIQQPENVLYALDQDEELIEYVINEFKKASNIIITGSGSSYHAALCGEYDLIRKGLKNVRALNASELYNYKNLFDSDTVFLALSQSGETMDLIKALKDIKKHKNSQIISMTNVPFSALDHIADINIPMNCGPEFGVVSTKTFTTQINLMTLLSYAFEGKLKEGKEKLTNMINQISESDLLHHPETTQLFLDSNDTLLFFGSGKNYFLAEEAALKFTEFTGMPAYAKKSAEFKHGPLTLIGKKNLKIIAIAPDDNSLRATKNALSEIISRERHDVSVVSDLKFDGVDHMINIPSMDIYDSAISILMQSIALDSVYERNNQNNAALIDLENEIRAVHPKFNPKKNHHFIRNITIT